LDQSGPNNGANASRHNVLKGGNGASTKALTTKDIVTNTKISKSITITLYATFKTENLAVFTVI